MDKSEKEFRAVLMQVGILAVLSLILLLLMSYLIGIAKEPTEVSNEWATNFDFLTATPTKALSDAEGGWWDNVETDREELPTMPGIELYATATHVPPPLTQTALALSPTVTATRTPLFDPNATQTPTPTREATQTTKPTGEE